jgi:hypothetical protein
MKYSKWDFSVLGLLKLYYRDLTAVVFFVFVYPQLTNESHMSFESKYFVLLCIFWIFMAVVGVVANILKLSTLDHEIHEKKLQKEVKATACRFLAGWISLPLMVLLPIFLLLGPNEPPMWFGGIFIILGLVLWIVFLNVGKGTESERQPRLRTIIISNVLLIFFELFVYTIFLESLWMNEGVGIQSIGTLIKLALPMSLLFCMLFLPATIGFYIEATVHHGSRALAFIVLLFRFLVFRYLPVFGLVFFEQHNIHFPWVM